MFVWLQYQWLTPFTARLAKRDVTMEQALAVPDLKLGLIRAVLVLGQNGRKRGFHIKIATDGMGHAISYPVLRNAMNTGNAPVICTRAAAHGLRGQAQTRTIAPSQWR